MRTTLSLGCLRLMAPLDKAVALLGHLLGILLAHGAAQQIGFAQRVAGEHVGDLHHLLLVDDDAQRLLEQGFQLRQLVADDLAAAPLALDEVVDHAALDRARTIERVEGGQVFHRVGLVAAQHIAHAAGLELEDAGSQRAMKDFLVGLCIVQRNQSTYRACCRVALDQLQRSRQ